MAIEVGKIFDGTVTGLAKFGAFIKLSTGETGLCHISEIADDYVKEVADHLKADQEVKVKVLTVDERGKISLSIRQASETAAEPKKSKVTEIRAQKEQTRIDRLAVKVDQIMVVRTIDLHKATDHQEILVDVVSKKNRKILKVC